MNLLEAIFHSALAQRLAQNTEATQQGQLAGRDVGNIPVLGGILTGGGQGNGLSPLNFLNTAGMVNEGAANLAKALTGLGLAGTGAVAQSPLLPATQEHRAEGAAALAAFRQPGNPYERALAANEAGAQGHGFAVGLVNAALNPLNYVGPAGDAGTALRTAQEAGPLARALGGALEATSLTGHAAMLPYQAGFGALGYGVKGVGRGLLGALRGGAPEAAQAAAPTVATAIDNAIAPAVADQAATAAAPGFGKATLDLLAAKGIDPAKLAGLDADMAHYVATNAGPGQEDGLIALLRGAVPTDTATSPVAEAVRALNPTPNVDALRQAATFSDDPAVAKAAREQLAALEAAPATAAPEIAPPAAPVTAALAALDMPPASAPATDLTARQDVLDTFGQMGSGDKARLLHDLLTANYGDQGGSVAALRNIYGRGFVGDKEITAAFDHLLQRTSEDPKALAALGEINAPLAHGIPTIEPSAQGATDLQNAIRQGLGQPPKKGTQFAAALSNVDIPAAPTAPADRAAWQAKYVGQSQAGTDILAAGDKVGASDLTQADLNALSPQERMAALRKLAGGGDIAPPDTAALKADFDRLAAAFRAAPADQKAALLPQMKAAAATYNAAREDEIGTAAFRKEGTDQMGTGIANALKPLKQAFGVGEDAAGGGGFGLLPARVGSTLAGAAGGGLLGAGLGAATHPEDRGRGAIGGGLLGAAAGGNLGSVAPELGAALPVARSIGADMAASMRQAAATGEQSILPGGGKAGKDRFAASTSYLRQARKTGLFTIARNLSDDAAKLAMAGENPLRYTADVAHMVGQSPTALPAIRGAAGDTGQIAMARYAQLPDRYRQQFSPGMFQKLLKSIGTDYANDPTDLGSANVHPGYGAIRGGLMSLLSPKVLVTGPVTPLLGAAEMASLPARVAAQQAVLGPADIAARLLPAADPAAGDLAAAAPAFIRKVAASGQSVALLPRSGAFDASLIKDPVLAAEWDATQQAAADKAGAVSKDILGNFATDSGARKVLNTLFPGAVWNIGQAQVLARAAARHPQAALAALNLMREDYQRHLAEGDPEHAGTYRLTDKTPGLGLLARIANGGAAGNYDVPLTYSFSPFGGETLNLPRQLDPYLNPGQSLYDKGKTVGAALGASDNPLLDMLAYRTGMASQPHVDPMRSAPIGQFADQMLAAKGALPLAANPLATALTPEGAQQDVGTALRLGRYLDPAALRAGAEIVQEQTGKPLIDRANIDYVAQLHDPTSPLYQQALARGLGGRAATAVAGEFIPGGPQATTATQAAVDQAQMGLQRQGLPVTRAQIAMLQSDPEGARAILGAQFQARVDQAKASNPLLATYDAANPGMLATLLMGQWARDNALLGFFPGILDFQRNIEAEKLGLLPPGTLAQKQQTMDLVNQGILPGLPQVAPGVPMQISPQGADAVRSLNQVHR